MINSLKIIRMIFKKYPLYIIYSFFISIISSSLVFANAISIKMIVGSLEANETVFTDVIKIVIYFIAFYACFSIIVSIYYKLYCPITEQKIKTTFKISFFNKVSKCKLISFEDSNFYDNLSKASDVVEKNLISTCDYFFSFCTSVFEVFFLSSIVIIFNYKIVFICLLFIIINLVLSFLTNKYDYNQYEKNIKNIRKHNYISSLFINKKYSEELKIYNLSPFLINQYNNITKNKISNIKKYSTKSSILTMIIKILQLSFSIIIIIVLANDVIKNKISLGVFSSMLVASQSFVSSFGSIFAIIPNLKKESLYLKNYFNFMNSDDEINGEIECDFKHLNIKTKNLSFSYPNEKESVINNVNFSFNKNNVIAIVGHNGAGKTTLIKLLIGEFISENGDIFYNKDNLKDINRGKLFDCIAIIPQNFNMYEFSVAENILMREYTESDKELVLEVLKKVGLLDKVNSLVNKENTILGKMFEENGTDFSGGEKQKIAIARALIKKPELIIMDEPTASLDPTAEKEIIDLSIEMFENKKMIIISHRLSMVLKADYIYLFEKGKIIEEGSHDELMSLKQKYYDLFMSQALNYIK